MPILARVGGDVAAGLGEQRGERDLAEEGRLAAHVGAGDQPQPVGRPKRDIVGDEALAGDAQRFLDHRVAAAVEFEARLVDQCGQAPAGLRGARWALPAATSIRAMASAVAAMRGAAATASAGQFLDMGGLGGERVGAGLDHAARLGVEVGRIEAHHAGQASGDG